MWKKVRRVEKIDFCMDTVINQKVYGEGAEVVSDYVTNEIHRIENLFSFFKDGSDISRINCEAGKNWIKVSDDTVSVLEIAKEVSEAGDGAFDVTTGILTDYWRRSLNKKVIPDKSTIHSRLSLVNYKDILIDREDNLVKLARAGQKIDLGGIGKGYTGERIKRIYQECSIVSAFINLGGNVVTIGKSSSGLPWTIGIRDPFSIEEKNLGILKVIDQAVVTSGDYERYTDINGIKYHHILDPRTGFPTQSGLRSVTIIAGSSALADALSTACFVLGLNKSLDLIKLFPNIKSIFITANNQIFLSRELKYVFKKIDQNREFYFID